MAAYDKPIRPEEHVSIDMIVSIGIDKYNSIMQQSFRESEIDAKEFYVRWHAYEEEFYQDHSYKWALERPMDTITNALCYATVAIRAARYCAVRMPGYAKQTKQQQ